MSEQIPLKSRMASWKAVEARYFPVGSLRARLARGSIWSTLGTVSLQGTAMLAAIFTARVLGKTGFGELGLVRSTVMTFGVLAGTGLGLATTKFVAEFRSVDPARAGRLIGLLLNVAFVLSGAATLACVALSSPIAARMMNAAWLAGPLRVGALLLFLGTVSGVQLGVLSGLEDFRAVALLSCGDAILTLSSTVLGAWLFGLTGAVAGAVLAAALAFPLKQIIVRRRCAAARIRISHRNVSEELPALWSFVLPAILLGVSAQPFEWMARVVLARRPNGFAELGLFTAAYAWGQVVLLVPSQVTAPSMPILANMYGRRDRNGFLRLLKFVAVITAGCGFAVALPLIAVSKWIMRAYGATFANGWRVLAIVAISYSVASLSSLFRATLVATGQMWWQNAHAAIWGATLAGSFFLLSSHGAIGLAFSYLIAFCVVVVTQGISAWVAVRRLGPHQPIVTEFS
jgi:O-antigen/teichoic acid export membrane protein